MVSLEKTYEEALQLAKSFDDNFLELAARLRVLKEGDAERYKDFVKASKVGSRKSYYLLEIHEAFEPFKISKKKLTQLGWTKLAILAPAVTKSNVAELLDLAMTNSVAKLKRIVAGEEPQSSERVLTLYLDDAQMKFVRGMLVRFGAEPSGRGLAGKEAALVAALSSIPV